MKKTILFSFTMMVLALAGCSSSGPSEEQVMNDSLTSLPDTLSGEKKEMVEFKLFYTIANLPSPVELISDIKNSDVPFNSDLMNPDENEVKYNSAFKKAINLGVYGVDLAYAAFYGQNQDLITAYLTTKKMAERMSIAETFETYTANFELNQSNSDSLVKMIDNAYTEIDNYLRKNNRSMAASQTLAGAIIEAEYLCVELMKNEVQNDENKMIFEKIYNQKLYLDNLISLFGEMKNDKDCVKFLNELKVQRAIFDGIPSAADLNSDNMAKLSTAVTRTRNSLIN
jgi:hypothetical protein